MLKLADILDNFEFLDDWEERYRYLIELGREMPLMPEADHIDAYKVLGCASQVWLKTSASGEQPPVLSFIGDSDAHIVRGLVALVITIFSGKSAQEILDTDAMAIFTSLGLEAHLTPQRSNGVRSMVERIKTDARAFTQNTVTG